MERVTEHLYCTPPEHPFANDAKTRAYLLRREGGNLLMYSSSKVREEEAHLRELGVVDRQYLNHRDEASEYCDWVTRVFDAPLVCHEREQEAVAHQCTVSETFDRRTRLHSDLEAIPTPGHCPGSTCYLWNAPDRRYLFTGDTIYLGAERWQVFVRGTVDEMIESLERIASLDFDVLVPGVHIGEAHLATTKRDATRRNIDEIIARLRRGEIH